MLSFLFAASAISAKPVKNGGCDLCHTATKIIRESVSQGFTDEQIKAALKASCPTLPSALVPACQNALKNIDAILKDVHAGKNDEYICKQYYFCETQKVSSKANARKGGLTSPACDVCTGIVSLVETLLNQSYTQDAIIKELDKLCDTMKDPLKSVCDTLVASYVPTIIGWIEKGIEEAQICTKLGFCTNSFARQANGLTCTVCTAIVDAVEKAMTSTKVESEVIALVEKICTNFPAPFSTLCDSLVEQYVPKIMQWLEQGLEGLEICSKLGLCETSEVLFRAKPNGLACNMCTTIVAAIEKAMTSTTVESEIIALVQQLCNKFPAPISTLCDSLVQQYIPTIMEWLEQGVEHLEICQKLGLCETLARQPNGLACNMCTTIVGAIEKAMVSTKVESEIIALVQQLCNKFQAPISTLCDSLVQQYVPTIMQWLEQGVEHLEICQKLGLCDTTKAARQTNGLTCTVCKAVVAAVEKAMTSTTVESEVIALVEQICNKFPAPVSTLCDSLVEQYVPKIMQWLEQGLDHLEICTKIGLCNSTSTAARVVSPANGVTCDICKDFFTWAGQEIEKYTVPYLWKLVNEECPKVPYLCYFCQIINEQNIETFVNLLVSAVPPQEACEFIKIC